MRIPSAWLACCLTSLCLLAPAFAGEAAARIKSPDGQITVGFEITADDARPHYTIERGGRHVLDGALGLVRDDADFTRALKLVSASAIEPVRDHYELFTAKRRSNTYLANRQIFHLQTPQGQKLDIVFQVSNDGVAFRYGFPENSTERRQLKEEVTSFHFDPATRAWLQPMSVAKTGWSQVNPCYEEFYEKDIPVGTPSRLAGWVYPALFRTGDTWVLLTEAGLGRTYCGTRLRAESPNGEYKIGFPDGRESFDGGAVNPESTLPWLTPWRVIAVGALKTVVESTLGTDLAEPPNGIAGTPTGSPGKAAWSWPLMGDRSTTFEVQKQFVDYAAEMGWRYCLVDALWDTQIGDEKMKELITYARTKNVAMLVWYNSAGKWNAAPQTPRDRLLTHQSRVQEFEKLKAMGVAGLKIDFFGGDGQSMINYYHDILADAAPFGFLLNFHGATLPRGWHRTYPQLMTMEAIKGLEYITFDQKNADEEPTHAAMLPFTRNIFDPMDFTPVVLDGIRKIERRTTSGFELALSVLFTSGIQHYAEIPSGMAKAPEYVRTFLKRLPTVWDDTKFIDGYPGKLVVLARQGGGHWYIAGINAEPTERKLSLDLSTLGFSSSPQGTLIADGEGGNLSFREEAVKVSAKNEVEVTVKPRGGFVIVLE